MGDYSFSLTTFSPTGKLVQIEYALQAVSAGKTSLGIKGTRSREKLGRQRIVPWPLTLAHSSSGRE